MTDALHGDALAAAARFELESRERHYPAQVASGKLTADEATIDYQAWHCIAGFMATGRFQSISFGGVDERTVVDWALAEAAADRAVASTQAALVEAAPNAAKAKRLTDRLAALHLIARVVTSQRRQVEAINREFRRRRQQLQQAAA